jgi:predicted MFS family arabinose efflux permease
MTTYNPDSTAQRDDRSSESPDKGAPRVTHRRALLYHQLPSRPAYVLMASIIALALFTSGTPSPLYETYRVLWGFSSVVLTLVYATYALGVLASLLLVGGISDRVGRRPVLIVALTALMLTTVVFMAADSLAWLFVARAIQGLATGLALGAAGAALLDLHPRRDSSAVGLANGVASTGGIGLGVLSSALIVEFLPAPRVLPYAAGLVLLAIAFLGALTMPETVNSVSRLRLTPQRPNVPPASRSAFILAALGVMSSWSIAGLFLALSPQLSATLFHSSDHLLDAASVFALAAPASLAQIAFRRTTPWNAAASGSLVLAAGAVAIVGATSVDSGALYLAASVIAGAGFGVAFLGALRALSGSIPAEHRGQVMSAFYLVAYSSLSLPAILAGVLDAPLGVKPTFEILGSVIAVVAVGVAVQARRTRPKPRLTVAPGPATRWSGLMTRQRESPNAEANCAASS